MHDGTRLGKGARIAINCFTFEEVNFLCKVLESKYNIIYIEENKYSISYYIEVNLF